MLKGKDEFKREFKYLSDHGVRKRVQRFPYALEKIDEICKLIPDHQLTGF